MDLDDADFGPSAGEKADIIDSLKEKYPMLDESIISMALEACSWDTNIATTIFEEQKEEYQKVWTVSFISSMASKIYQYFILGIFNFWYIVAFLEYFNL